MPRCAEPCGPKSRTPAWRSCYHRAVVIQGTLGDLAGELSGPQGLMELLEVLETEK